MKLHVLNTGYFKLDGGAMFGVVPKAYGQGLIPQITTICAHGLCEAYS